MTDKQTAIEWLIAHDMIEEADAARAKSCECHQCAETTETELTATIDSPMAKSIRHMRND
jgi:hypothetical protein